MMLLFINVLNGLPGVIILMYAPFAGRIKCTINILANMMAKVLVFCGWQKNTGIKYGMIKKEI